MKLIKVVFAFLLIFILSFNCIFAGKSDPKGFEYGNLSDESTEDKTEIASKFLKNQKSDFKLKSQSKDAFGITTLKYQQEFEGIPVFGHDQIINVAKNGIIKSHVGTTALELDVKLKNKQKKINKNQALKIVEADLNYSAVYDEKPLINEYIYIKDSIAHYVYIIELKFLDPEPGHWKYFISLTTGEILNKYNRIAYRGKPSSGSDYLESNTVEVSGTGSLGDNRIANGNLHTDGIYYLVDLTRGKGIFTYDAANRKKSGSNLDNSYTNIFDDPAAIDCQYHLAKVYDFYKILLGRDSLDGNGMQIRATVHYGRNYDNAYWYNGELVFGDGDGINTRAYSAGLDVVGHEFTHGVDQYTCALEYQNEPGAISEALAEIMGTAIEQYSETNPDWLGGEDVTINGQGMNSLSDPTIHGHPDHVSKKKTGTADNGYVHDNSHIITKAAYLISEGGTHYNVSVQGQGYQVMAKVFYRAMTTYLTNTSSWSQCKQAVIAASNDLYGTNSSQSINVKKAFDAVGIQ